MNAKFDRIVDFAELWEFIDSPMRTYSSGMWARLGFSVATDTKPDVLIIDEILGVGDESFQRKSSARIISYKDEGATILMVSHNSMTIETLCQRSAWLDHGHLIEMGESKDVVAAYRASQNA
jgi:ABC-type polysaccharide/polyol phosphate transport system ATPase subunit